MSPEFKKKFIAYYIITGLTWCAINLPNLIEQSRFNNFFACGLALARIVLWPVFLGIWIHNYISSSKNNYDESDDE
jgi:hypothetical protein